MNELRRLFALFLFVCWISVSHAAELPEIDFLVNIKINTNKDHQTVYTVALTTELQRAFGLPAAANTRRRTVELRDGAAKFRLFVDGTINTSVGSSIISETEKAVAINNQRGDNYTVQHLYLPISQQGTLQFRLARWDETKYTDVEKWTAPVPRSDEENLYNGKVKVADITNVQGQSSLKIEEAQQQALLKLMPGPMADAVFAHWIQVTAVKVTPAGNGLDAEISVKNTSPWALKRLRTAVTSIGKLIVPGETAVDGAWVTFKEPLSPSKEPFKLTIPALPAAKDVRPGIQAVEILPVPPAAAPAPAP